MKQEEAVVASLSAGQFTRATSGMRRSNLQAAFGGNGGRL